MMDESLGTSRERERRAVRRWRGSEYALVVAMVVMAVQAGCAAGGGVGGRPALPVPAEFRERLGRLVGEKRWEEASGLIKETPPELLARSASERGDVRYMAVEGVGQVGQVGGMGRVVPGIEARPKGAPPIRTWTVPGTGDAIEGEAMRRYDVLARDFARSYNRALAAEEKGVR